MTTRLADRLFLAGFILVGIVYVYQSLGLAADNPAAGLGLVLFPITLGALLVLLCLAEFFLSARAKASEGDDRLSVPNAGKLAATVVLSGLYFLAWEWTGQFYAVTAVFFFALVTMYQEERTLRRLAVAALVSVLFAAALYLVFGLAFGIRLA